MGYDAQIAGIGDQYNGASDSEGCFIVDDGRYRKFGIRNADLGIGECFVPVIASGGAGKIDDFITLFKRLPKVDAGLAASIFHFGEVKISDLKQAMAAEGITARL